MNLKLFFVSFLYIFYHWSENCNSETITYIITEHPEVYWYDPLYAKNVRVTSRRINRQDPRYYVNLYLETLTTWNNQYVFDFYFHQFLTNRYRPSFVELHLKFCDLLEKDLLIGASLKHGLGNRSCPIPPGKYDMRNMYIPFVPKGFPFMKGRIICNISHVQGGVAKLIGSGHADMEVKVSKIIENGKKSKV